MPFPPPIHTPPPHIHYTPVCAYRHYFALPTNPGEQFFAFTNLATWLLTLCGKKLEQPQEVCELDVSGDHNSELVRDSQLYSCRPIPSRVFPIKNLSPLTSLNASSVHKTGLLILGFYFSSQCTCWNFYFVSGIMSLPSCSTMIPTPP